jgi:predicted nucleic acid-binding protein
MRRSRQRGLLSDAEGGPRHQCQRFRSRLEWGALTVVSDDDDNRVLEAAIEGDADYIVSGDADLLDLGSFQGITIITPGEFAATVLGGGSGEL